MSNGIHRTSLTAFANSMQDEDPVRSFEMCRDAFRKAGVVCIRLRDMEDRHGWAAARQLRNLGEQYFGKQK